MEGGKKSSSSFTSELFGSKDSDVAASSSGIFGTIFAPPAKKAGGNDYLRMPEKEKKQDSGSQSWNSKTAVSESNASGGGNFQRSEGKDMGSFYPVENVHPCHYSSSIYYGGQDVYSRPQTTAQSTVFTTDKHYSLGKFDMPMPQKMGEKITFNKDGGEDDKDGASRGNWWQGSLYY